jgi:hypothetical protein
VNQRTQGGLGTSHHEQLEKGLPDEVALAKTCRNGKGGDKVRATACEENLRACAKALDSNRHRSEWSRVLVWSG